jgi:hypothetical protein
MTRIIVHIDRLVLRGYLPHDRLAIGDALRRALADRLASPERARALATQPGTERMRLPGVAMPRRANPAQVGARLGAGIARGLAP